jgi:Domain of unknown function (DUF5664)
MEGQTTLTGVKHDGGKLRIDLVPYELIAGNARAMGFGALKYGDNNWRGGLKWSRCFGALCRHLWDWWRGAGPDPESGLDHLDHAAACLGFLMEYQATKTGEDDRYKM